VDAGILPPVRLKMMWRLFVVGTVRRFAWTGGYNSKLVQHIIYGHKQRIYQAFAGFTTGGSFGIRLADFPSGSSIKRHNSSPPFDISFADKN